MVFGCGLTTLSTVKAGNSKRFFVLNEINTIEVSEYAALVTKEQFDFGCALVTGFFLGSHKSRKLLKVVLTHLCDQCFGFHASFLAVSAVAGNDRFAAHHGRPRHRMKCLEAGIERGAT